MEGNIVNKFFSKIRDKLNTNGIKDNYPQASEYVFNEDELNNLSKQNNEKIKELKTNFLNKKEDIKEKMEEVVDDLLIMEEVVDLENNCDVNNILDDNGSSNSYINLTASRKDTIMKRWSSIDIVKLDKDIDKGKDIVLHNYTITYGDDALAYIYRIRDEYDILIEYLIGFNNEKKGFYNKTTFSDKLDDEWRYLNNYIKVLEMIRMTIKK